MPVRVRAACVLVLLIGSRSFWGTGARGVVQAASCQLDGEPSAVRHPLVVAEIDPYLIRTYL